MTKHVAFFRGINVGGHNMVKMDVLKRLFNSMGFNDVMTIKQSGNVVFESNSVDKEILRKNIEKKVAESLGIDVHVIVRTMPELQKIVQKNPFKEVDERKVINLWVTFLSEKPKGKTELPIAIPKTDAEVIAIYGTEAYSVTRTEGDGGKPNPFIESLLKVGATTRSWGMVKEIVGRG